MKLSRKLITLSAAALMTVSPIVILAASNVNTVQAASEISKTNGKNKVTVTKNMYFVDKNGKKTNKKAYKNGKYIVWLVTTINGKTYYGIQTDAKYWIPASATEGKVTIVSTSKTNSSSKKSSSKTTKKTTTKKESSKKTSTKSSSTSKSNKPVKLITTRASQVYDKNGKAVDTYMGSKKYATIGKGVKINGLGTKTIKGVKYYALQPNHYYIKAANVKER